jgi:NADPH:quinone reductase-like Zn-dependent oxidoreductase
MPDNMTFEDAAALPHAAMLAWQGLEILGIRPGNKVLINGAGGGVGSLIIQMIPKGVEVSGVDSLQKLEQMKSWGYDHVYDYAAVNFTRLNKKYDAILDVKTMQGPWDYARALKNGGCYVTVGGTIPQLLRLLAGAPLVKLIRNRSLKVLGLKPNKGLVHVSQMYEQGTLKPALDGPYPMDKIPELIPYFAKGKHVGKIIIRIPDRI